MASNYMTRQELERFYLDNIRMYSKTIYTNPLNHCDLAIERIDDNKRRLVEEFGYSWDRVDQLEVDAWKDLEERAA